VPRSQFLKYRVESYLICIRTIRHARASWISTNREGAICCRPKASNGLSKLHALVHLRKGATENRDEARLPFRIHQREAHSDSQNAYARKSKKWMLRLWGSSDASNLRGQLWYVPSSSYCPFIHLSTLAECRG